MGQPPNLLGSFDNHGDGTQNTNLGDGSQNNNNSSGQQTTISVGTGFVTAYIASNHQDEQFQNQGNIHDTEIIRSLAFPQMRDRRDHIEPWYRNTCRWILEREECRSWREQPRGLLWIAGKPGSGKSTLMAFLHEKLCKSSDASQDLRLEFFFTARGTELQRTPLGMFRSLLVQILKSNATVCDDLRKAYLERCRDFGECDWEWPQVLLEKLLQDAICKLAALQQVTIFVDALDEAGETDARKLVNYFQGLNDAAKKSQARAKICISCRHYPSVAPFGVAEIVVDQHNHEDIATYIRSHLPSDILVTDGRHYEGWKDLMNQLTDQANGVFQWAHIVMPLIRGQIDDGRSPKDIRRWLRNVPADLESVYQYVLVHVIKPENRVQSLQFFQWVGLAERPLAVTEMRYAMAACHVDATRSYVQWQEVDNFITTDERMRRLIKALSGGLAEVVKGHESGDVVQVVHQTVNEFIRATGLALLSRVANPMITCIENCTIILQSQAMLYQSCLFCLATAEMPLANLQNTRDMEEVPSKNGPFLAYATVNLLIHAEKAGNFRSFALEWEVQILERMVGRWVKFYQLFDPVGVACPRNGTTILHMAAAANMTDVAAFAASNNGNVTVVDVRGNTPFHLAARCGHIEVGKIFLKMGAKLDTTCREGETALVNAASRGHVEFVEWLLEEGAAIDTTKGSSGGALQAASLEGKRNIVRILLDAKADVNAQGGRFGTALQAASSEGSTEVVKILLDAKADVNVQAVVNAQGGEYGTALQAASNNASAEVVKMLLDAGADINAQGGQYGTAILAAVHKDFSFQIEILLRAGADPSLLDNLHRSPIHIAAAKGLLPILRQFPALSSAINSQDILSRTPLHLAVLHGHEDFALALLEMNADPLLRDEYGRNILDYAVEYPRLVARLHDFFPGIMQTDQLEQRARVQQSILQISNTMLCSISDPARPFLPLLHQLGHYLLFLGDADNAHSILSLNLDHGKLQIGANEDLICDTCYRDIHGMRIICRLCLGLNFCLSCNHKYPTHGRWNPHRVHDLVVVPYKQPPDLHHAMERLKDLLQHIARQYGGISELPPNTQPDFPTPRGPHPLATPLVFGLLATSLCTWHLLRRN
ncbi:hypothetical protein PDE_04765 [Penicillium oxalicum 114-2]|uniref:NACHT domain-containing protein n=1 Tax=Penicillium oxalicum (strain 114-2 / CGMCC 5302) TaxID=933388 RepID=S7ZGL7_PENO1|nr:hypothetical protein PDE_04765 [Penicillium oxalicum 114-2]